MENNNNQNQNQQIQTQPVQAPGHGAAVASLVLGIIGICCCGICGIIALVKASEAKKLGNDESIRTAGFILGIIGIALWVIGIIVGFTTGSFSGHMNF